ncbi:NAD(P)H-dependent glycerol-3-phosphate dehydrogenase [Lyngbya confervoides]|uniref:Glycerol-3-phosphate dehydrogenase [NAD(P)+] n=1 Tax=Lyngbya confervoides BDU141951 TaxID=1574623 RepID=A0ABD4T3N5_9CYAN|nr:NAD(P)H-dependent glycerol-3-phosphate dehydrogenase [Lyngbya confervoides]MCM1983436.1 NAD(P)H-dependent glycerol-3-phosphate dehydrogenase [Lyngbya confervoides BDU141951]
MFSDSLPARVTILGAGAWGCCLETLLREQQHQVTVWSRRYHRPLAAAIQNADVVISALSMQGVPIVAAQLKALGIPPQTLVVSATKGLNPGSYETPSQLWHQALPNNPIVVLSGPNLAAEIEAGLPAATVVASEDLAAAQRIQTLLNSERFRVYTNGDPLGTELGGTLKNIIAIAVGVCDGLNLGTNAKSALMTRALVEMTRIGVQLGAQPQTFWGLSGLGDMIATCSSALSRNYRVGYGLAQGQALGAVLAEIGSTAEGVNTAQVLVDLAGRDGIDAPIATAVAQILAGHMAPAQAIETLMSRLPRAEVLEIQRPC